MQDRRSPTDRADDSLAAEHRERSQKPPGRERPLAARRVPRKERAQRVTYGRLQVGCDPAYECHPHAREDDHFGRSCRSLTPQTRYPHVSWQSIERSSRILQLQNRGIARNAHVLVDNLARCGRIAAHCSKCITC